MCREYADRIVALANLLDQRYMECNDMEPQCEEMLSIAVAHPECRAELSSAFVEVSHIVYEAVEFCMHVLRWEEVRQTFQEQLKAAQAVDDWCAIPVLLSMLESFDDDWDGRDFWARFR